MYSVGWAMSVAGWDPDLTYVSCIVALLNFGSDLLGTINSHTFVFFSSEKQPCGGKYLPFFLQFYFLVLQNDYSSRPERGVY